MYVKKLHFILIFIETQNMCVKCSVTACISGVQYMAITVLCLWKICFMVTFSPYVTSHETGEIRMPGTSHFLSLLTLGLLADTRLLKDQKRQNKIFYRDVFPSPKELLK
jgi:hypothetical protein